MQKRHLAAKKVGGRHFEPVLAMEPPAAPAAAPLLHLDESMCAVPVLRPWSCVLPCPSAEAYGTAQSDEVFFVCRMDMRRAQGGFVFRLSGGRVAWQSSDRFEPSLCTVFWRRGRRLCVFFSGEPVN